MASSPRLLTSTRTPSSPGFDFQRMANRATPPPSLNGVPIPHLGTGDQKSTPTAVPIHGPEYTDCDGDALKAQLDSHMVLQAGLGTGPSPACPCATEAWASAQGA
ncbi:uncharacterized protein PGTG_04456 [Puccinia graminis f. sp. tritici CRL 75-36-700-3]|uniref:Uncharacterized protein n=1 Tax=Puccinia graminis f. sp. tritici (strain CRL 75-36-700-3 / race SCCL) TaxID=418459 RepID=E3K2D1_PUCGT|nr:uncharacterized protein PGTG_04456 [Puccinia graminis f. sp. tritici CRL 75-36-700-3]EFP78500.1 hypothetical protein PGTG_04456 [Puccinia graminis f. sp. tritici CRL 75-36-700-3]